MEIGEFTHENTLNNTQFSYWKIFISEARHRNSVFFCCGLSKYDAPYQFVNISTEDVFGYVVPKDPANDCLKEAFSHCFSQQETLEANFDYCAFMAQNDNVFSRNPFYTFWFYRFEYTSTHLT